LEIGKKSQALIGGAWDFLFLGKKEKSSPQRTQMAHRREKREKEEQIFWRWIVRAHPLQTTQVHLCVGVRWEDREGGVKPACGGQAAPTMGAVGVGQLRCGDTENE
jgi:hypothetical protein